jgi:hypothetical protein
VSGKKPTIRGHNPLLKLFGEKMFKNIDNLDELLLRRIVENQNLCVREVIEPFFYLRSESTLRARIRALALRGLIPLKAEKDRVMCYPADEVKQL